MPGQTPLDSPFLRPIVERSPRSVRLREAPMSRIDSAQAHHPTRARAVAATLLVGALVSACGGSTAGEVDERYGVANQLAGSTFGQGGAGGSGPTGQAGSAGTGGAGGTGGSAAMAPPMPAAPADPNAPSGPPQACNGTPAPVDGLLVDFATYTPRTATGGGTWGDMGLGQITGGTSVYSADAASALTIVVENGELHLSATMEAAISFTGIVLWFAPCVDATAFNGFAFPISGELGGANLLVKAQTSPDYPVDVTNAKGKCPFEREENKFNECQQPTATLSALTENPVTLEWAEFVMGTPVPAVDPAQLLGFELQFACNNGGCAFDVSVGDVSFIAP
jgi:hypothetical protein